MSQLQNIVVISNIAVGPFLVPILQEYVRKNYENASVITVPYQEYRLEEYRPLLKEADIVVIWLNMETMIPEIFNGDIDGRWKEQKIEEVQSFCRDVAEYISLSSNSQILWLLFEDYYLRLPVVTGRRSNRFIEKINWRLQEELGEYITFVDLKYLIAEVGIGKSFSVKNKFRWNFPYSKYLTIAVADEIQKQYFVENGISKKCLVLDCDNVLWGGVLSEDGIEGIRLGSSGLGWEYQEFQRFVLSLYYRGVILAISSKNDLVDVLQVFRHHNGMLLKEEHIACFQVNWENKPDNIKKIAEKLNIGVECMVFVDDSPIEIEAVKTILPEVVAIQYDRETMYKKFSCFNLKENPNYTEVIKRNNTYRTEVRRQEIKEKSGSYRDYLSALEMKVEIHEIMPSEYGRIAELTQRTNRCTNGIRCTISDIKGWSVDKDVYLYTVTLADRFSDMGIVGVFGVWDNKLILFSLSCRALGREIEDKILKFVKERHDILQFDFIDTGKNENLKTMFQKKLWRESRKSFNKK